MGAVGRINTRKAHRNRGEPVHPNPRCQGFLIRDTNHALRRHRNLVPPLGEGIREVENVALLAADVRRKELGQQKDAHQRERPRTLCSTISCVYPVIADKIPRDRAKRRIIESFLSGRKTPISSRRIARMIV